MKKVSEAQARNAIREGGELSGTDMRGLYLYNACLVGVDMRGADLRGADLEECELDNANLANADLRGVNFRRADMFRTNLSNAALEGATLYRADLVESNLRDARLSLCNLTNALLDRARLNWQSHSLLAEILRQSALFNLERLKIAGVVAISPHLCWNELTEAMRSEPEEMQNWVLDTLAKWSRYDNGAPFVLRELVRMHDGLSVDHRQIPAPASA